MITKVDFFFSLGSRYSYLASTQIAALERDTGCRVNWIPLNSGELLWRKKHNPFEGNPVSGQYEWCYRELDAQRWASYYGVPFVEPRGRVEFDPALLGRAATAAKRIGFEESYSRALFAAMFVEPDIREIGREECARRAALCGYTEGEFLEELDNPLTEAGHSAVLTGAAQVGVFGVPTFVVNENLFWGNDRLVLLRDYLRKYTSGV